MSDLRMELDRHPNGVRVGPPSMPGINEGALVFDPNYRVMGIAGSSADFPIHLVASLVVEKLNTPMPEDLRMKLKERVRIVDHRVGARRSPPKIELNLEVLKLVLGLRIV